MKRRFLQVGAGVLLGLVTVAVVLRVAMGADPAAADPHVLSPPLPGGELGLTAHTGERVTVEDLPHRYTVVFFGYTHCPDVCPVTLANLTQAVESLGDAGQDVGAVLVSVDPVRDTPERLARYMEAFHPNFLGLTGSEEDVRRVAESWGAYHAVGHGSHTEDEYLVDHTGRAYVVGRNGAIVASFAPHTGPAEMSTTLRRLLERG